VAVFLAAVNSPALVKAQPITVTDQRGKTVELRSPAERMIVIPIPMTSVVMALDGSSRRLIGIHPIARKSIKDGFLNRVFPEAQKIQADIVRGGRFNPNLESILALRPDLVVQWSQPASIIDSLERAGIKAVGLINNPPTQEINIRNLTILATVIGQRDRLNKLLAKHREVLGKVFAKTKNIVTDQRPRALYFRSAQVAMRPAGAATYQDFWIKLAGGQNVAATQFKGLRANVNTEQIIKWNPELIFLGAFDGATPEKFMAISELQGVAAIRSKRVYKMPHGGYRWDPGSHESFLTWQWAAMLIQPDIFRFDLRREMREGYRFLYNYDLTDDEIDEILHMKLNQRSAGYDRFKR
jgi:iron complex transport system substrate-binding protein